MKKVLQRTAMAKRQALRKARIAKEMDEAVQRRLDRREAQQIKALANHTIKEARLRRREDYDLGPLAPRRDIGEHKDTWGTIEPQRLQPIKVAPEKRLQYTPFTEGDRVVIVNGRDKGKIGEIRDVDDEAQAVRVKGMNQADVAVPEYMREVESDPRPFRTVELQIPFSDIRLVHPWRNPKTGEVRDVICNEVVRRPNGTNEYGEPKYIRVVPGTDIRIEWPQPPEPENETTEADTLRIFSEEETFVPTLLRPPMPGSVIDELRNKYSYFRDRHDPEYTARKTAEDAAEREKHIMAKRMMTPLKEFHARQRMENKAKGRQPLPEDALAKIGELMAAKKAEKRAEKSAAKAARIAA